MDPLLILVFIVAAFIAVVPGTIYARHLWTERQTKRRAEKERQEKLEQELQEILSKDARARHEYYYPYPIGQTVDKEEFVKRYRQGIIAADHEEWKRRLIAEHEAKQRQQTVTATRVVASSSVRISTTTTPRRDPVDDLVDTAIGVGIGMAIGSMMDDDNNRTSTSDNCGSDDSFTSGGGDFGGGGASGSWDDDR